MSALVNRLRKHMTDSLADVDCASLHKHMLNSKLSGWGIVPLQWVHNEWLASVRERHWWWIFRRWACNDVAPGISTSGEGSKSRGWLNQRVLAAPQGIKDARQIDDYPRVHFLQAELRDLACKLSILVYLLGTITFPNLNPSQKRKCCYPRGSPKNGTELQDPSLGETSTAEGSACGALQPSNCETSIR